MTATGLAGTPHRALRVDRLGQRQRTPADVARNAAWGLLLIGVVLMFGLSASTLAWLGVPYDRPGGPMWVKLHLSTYAFVAACGLGLMSLGNPLSAAFAVARHRPLVVAYLGSMVFVGLWDLWLHGSSGAAFFVDALWAPGFALIALLLQPRERQRTLFVLMMALLCLNAAVALMEAVRGRSFIPQDIGLEGLLPELHFRASALLGHPLANALKTAMLLPALLLLPVSGALLAALAGLLALALLAFGGRAALAVALTVYGSAALGVLAWRAVHGRYSYRQWTGGLLLGLLGLLGLAGVVAATGLGERVFANLAWDNSAGVRLVVWNALAELSPAEWWTGVSPARIDVIKVRIGLDPVYEAIENYWVALLMQVGLLGFAPFVIGLGCGTWQIWRDTAPAMRLGIVVFYLVGSGANTLATKTFSLTMLFLVCCGAGATHVLSRSRQPLPRPMRSVFTSSRYRPT